MTAPTTHQALCPRCNRWSDLAWDDAIPPGGFWWKDTAGCPRCGYMALPESECEHREVPAGYLDPHDRVAGAWFDLKVAVADRVGPPLRRLVDRLEGFLQRLWPKDAGPTDTCLLCAEEDCLCNQGGEEDGELGHEEGGTCHPSWEDPVKADPDH